MKKNKTLNNTLYCIKYIWKIDAKYILLMIMIAVLTSIFNVINLSILRYITDTLTKKETGHFLGVIGVSEKFGIENQLIQYHEILERNPKLLEPLNEMELD